MALLFFNKNSLAHVNRHSIDDFVLCQGESGSGASLGACDGSGTVCRVRPVVRLMSDRESASGASKPPLGFAVQVHAPKSDSEGSEALCVLIRILSRSPQGMGKIPGPVPEMIEIRVNQFRCGMDDTAGVRMPVRSP